eukprot:TRINITY_DN420_c0_g2_i2.p1 TRINITY_DN420_c0_g2~~TRINITY_DN420_c0_g2_i2.p1  ORF type:complete len:165 (+),score=41.72 TRINITY_DN420_c0_g2_i2:682-1176(+)
MFKKVVADAEFYDLQGLQKLLRDAPPDENSTTTPTKPFLQIRSTAAVTAGALFNWNGVKQLTETHFKHDGRQTITILKDGLYCITVRYTSQCSTHGLGAGNVDLLLNGAVVARNYHGDSAAYIRSWTLSHVAEVKAPTTVQVQYFSNYNGVADADANCITIVPV